MMRAWLPAAFFALTLAAHVQGADVPYLTGRVVDNAEILKPDTRRQITELLRIHEQQTTNQIAVLTMCPSTGSIVTRTPGENAETASTSGPTKNNNR